MAREVRTAPAAAPASVKTVTTTVIATTPNQATEARFRARRCTSPSVFSRHPQRAVLRQREERQHADRDRVPVQNPQFAADAEIRPQRQEESSGCVQRALPGSRCPSAAPKKIASSALDAVNPASQNGFHTGLSMWLRNSIEMPRRISSQSTIISGR